MKMKVVFFFNFRLESAEINFGGHCKILTLEIHGVKSGVCGILTT